MYLQYDQETDYIIDLDNVYKWITDNNLKDLLQDELKNILEKE